MTADQSTPERRLAAFIAKAKARPHSRFDFENWEDPNWSVRCTEGRNPRSKRSLWFTTCEPRDWPERDEPPIFNEPFASFARGLCVHLASSRLVDGSFSPIQRLLFALRRLYRRCPRASPTLLLAEHFDQAITDAFANGAKVADVSALAERLDYIQKAMDAQRLTAHPIEWTRSVRFDTESRYEGEEGERRRDAKLMSEAELLAWATLSADPGPDPFDRIRQRLVDLMMCGGFRMSEALMLPVDTLVRETITVDGELVTDEEGRPVVRYGLRYWPLKTNNGLPLIKPIPTAMGPVAERAVAEVKTLTRRARAVAFAFYNGETPFDEDPWEDFDGDTSLTAEDVGFFLGGVEPAKRGRRFIRDNKIPFWIVKEPYQREDGPTRVCAVPYVKKRDLEAALRKVSFDKYNKQTKSGTVYLHDCLFTVPWLMKHGYAGVDGTATLLMDTSINQYLKSKLDRPSAFERRGLLDPQTGEPVFVTTHMFRFYLNTLAHEKDLPQADLAAWMGRKHVGSNRVYDLRSVETKAKRLEDSLIRLGVQAPKQRAPVVEGGTFEDELNPEETGHVTAAGVCHFDYAMDPCSHLVAALQSGNWVKGLRGLEEPQLAALVDRLGRLESAAENAAKEGVFGADQWLALHKSMHSEASSHVAILKMGRPGHAQDTH